MDNRRDPTSVDVVGQTLYTLRYCFECLEWSSNKEFRGLGIRQVEERRKIKGIQTNNTIPVSTFSLVDVLYLTR